MLPTKTSEQRFALLIMTQVFLRMPHTWGGVSDSLAAKVSYRFAATTMFPFGTLHRQEAVMPNINGNVGAVTQNAPTRNVQRATKRRSSGPRNIRSNAEWRKDLIHIYSSILASRKEKRRVTLNSFCSTNVEFTSSYKTIAGHWRALNLESCLSEGIEASDPAIINRINHRFELKQAPQSSNEENNDAAAIPIRKRGAKNVMRTNTQWRGTLLDMYAVLFSARQWNRKDSIRSYCMTVLKTEQNYRRICDVWRELRLDDDISNGVEPCDASIISKIESKYPKNRPGLESSMSQGESQSQRDLRPTSSSYFDEQEEAYMCEIVAGFARAGYPFEKANLKGYADAFLEADKLDGDGMATGGISNDTIERIYRNGQLSAKSNVNSIDPKRASQADPLVLNAMYHQLDAVARMAHEINPDVWPEDRFANVPATVIYNVDEQGPNTTKLRNPVLIPIDMIKNLDRLFQNTREGDGKMPIHYSVANVVRADGVQSHPDKHVEGAPAPYVLISDSSSTSVLDSMEKAERDRILANQSESDSIELNDTVLHGWYDDFQVGNKDELVNPFGFLVRTTPSGSMLKRTFYDFVTHFRKQLPHYQGPNGRGVWLFLDWHSSRECPQSLLTSFFLYNILIYILPAKTSIWSQPCDMGKNLLTARDIAFAAHNLGFLDGAAIDHQDANKVFRAGLERNCTQQNDELRRRGTNAVVSSFRKAGLCPMDYDNEGWNMAFENFNKLNSLVKQKRRDAGEPVPDIIWVPKPKPINEREELTQTDVAAIKGFLVVDDTDFMRGDTNETEDRRPIDIPLLFLAMAIADYVVGKYVLDAQRDLTQPPVGKEDFEIAALKLIRFEAVTVDNRVDTTCTLSREDIARDKLITKLSITPFGHSISLRKRDAPNRVLNLMKQSRTRFLVLDGEKRDSRNLQTMSFESILDQCYDGDDDDQYTLTRKDKRKSQAKARVRRKKLNDSMYEEATEIANDHRTVRNLDLVKSKLKARNPRFAARLETILEEDDDWDMHALYQTFEDVVLAPYEEVVPVTRGDTTKDIAVTAIGSDISAVSHKAELTLMKLMLDMKSKSANPKARRRRRRGPGQSTQLGKSGMSVGILLQRDRKVDELKLLEKKENALVNELDGMKSLLARMNELREQNKKKYWKVDVMKGKKRELLARLFDVYKSSAKAEEESNALRALHLSKAMVDAKIQDLRSNIELKETNVQPIIAKRREAEDFLDSTSGHAQVQQEEAEVGAEVEVEAEPIDEDSGSDDE